MSSLRFALFFPHYDSCLLPPSPHPVTPPPSPSLFLANLKFVRRLRLLDGWPLIFCELHLAQTSPRPWCILLTAALAAGPRHSSSPRPPPMLTHYRSVGTSLTPTSLLTAHMQTHLKTNGLRARLHKHKQMHIGKHTHTPWAHG